MHEKTKKLEQQMFLFRVIFQKLALLLQKEHISVMYLSV